MDRTIAEQKLEKRVMQAITAAMNEGVNPDRAEVLIARMLSTTTLGQVWLEKSGHIEVDEIMSRR